MKILIYWTEARGLGMEKVGSLPLFFNFACFLPPGQIVPVCQSLIWHFETIVPKRGCNLLCVEKVCKPDLWIFIFVLSLFFAHTFYRQRCTSFKQSELLYDKSWQPYKDKNFLKTRLRPVFSLKMVPFACTEDKIQLKHIL